MGIREDFLRTCLPAADPNVVVGRCHHTCRVRVNMGTKNPDRIGMRSHFVSPRHLLNMKDTRDNL